MPREDQDGGYSDYEAELARQARREEREQEAMRRADRACDEREPMPSKPQKLTGLPIPTPEVYVPHRKIPKPGAPRPSWDEYFLEIAEVVSSRSMDPDTRHGCVLVDANHRIISTGYNGPISGLDDKTIPLDRPAKYLWFMHAEDNAILFARASLETATAYVTGYPCAACLRRLLQAGVSRIVCGVRSSACITNEEREACEEMARQVSAKIEIRP